MEATQESDPTGSRERRRVTEKMPAVAAPTARIVTGAPVEDTSIELVPAAPALGGAVMKKDSINAPLIASAVIAATLVALAFALPSPAHERWVMPAFAAIVVVCSLWLVYAVGRSRR